LPPRAGAARRVRPPGRPSASGRAGWHQRHRRAASSAPRSARPQRWPRSWTPRRWAPGPDTSETCPWGDKWCAHRHVRVFVLRTLFWVTVIAAGRDAAKLAALANKVADQVPGAMVESLVLDLADLASVGRLPRRCWRQRGHDRTIAQIAIRPCARAIAQRPGNPRNGSLAHFEQTSPLARSSRLGRTSPTSAEAPTGHTPPYTPAGASGTDHLRLDSKGNAGSCSLRRDDW
jgi:hypothetical protein